MLPPLKGAAVAFRQRGRNDIHTIAEQRFQFPRCLCERGHYAPAELHCDPQGVCHEIGPEVAHDVEVGASALRRGLGGFIL